MSDVHAANARLRRVAHAYATHPDDDGWPDHWPAFMADLFLTLDALHDATVLLGEYAHRGRDIEHPSPASLIGQTRTLLARLEETTPS